MGLLVVSSMIAMPVAAAMQLNKGFRKTLVFSILFGFIDIMAGLVTSYNINAAPGGTIALTSVAVLVLVMAFMKIRTRSPL
jgi:zinc transport system permease protein